MPANCQYSINRDMKWLFPKAPLDCSVGINRFGPVLASTVLLMVHKDLLFVEVQVRRLVFF
jgi:hypothetical protein